MGQPTLLGPPMPTLPPRFRIPADRPVAPSRGPPASGARAGEDAAPGVALGQGSLFMW
jgi:hypothetical protein